MKLHRTLKHLTAPSGRIRRTLTASDLDAISEAITRGEKMHRGEIRIVVEGPMPFGTLWRDETCRQRAAALFQTYGVGNTRDASGILLYIQLLERRVEILADNGITKCLAQSEWDEICRTLEQAFSGGAFRNGILQAVDRMNTLLATHFPADMEDNPNELSNRPALI